MERHADTESSGLNPFPAILFSIVVFMVGSGLLLYRARETPASQQFVETPQFLVWLFLIGAQVALWALFILPLGRTLRKLKAHFAGHTWEILGAASLFTMLLAIPAILPARYGSHSPLAYHRVKVGLLYAAGSTLALLAAVGLWLVRAALQRLGGTPVEPVHHLAAFIRLREQSQWFVTMAATVLVLATLGASALRNAILTVAPDTAKTFPPELVLLYGTYFSLLLALAYAPTHLALQATGRYLRDTYCPMPQPDSASWVSWYTHRKGIEELLQFQLSTRASVQTGVAIVAPLAGSVVSVLFGGGK